MPPCYERLPRKRESILTVSRAAESQEKRAILYLGPDDPGREGGDDYVMLLLGMTFAICSCAGDWGWDTHPPISSCNAARLRRRKETHDDFLDACPEKRKRHPHGGSV